MKLLFYINTLSHGGAEKVLSNLANMFYCKGKDVVFVTSYPVYNGYELHNGIKHIYLEKSKNNSGVLKRNIIRTIELRKIIKEEKPNVVISFLPESNFRAIVAARSMNVPVIISVRNDPQKEYASSLYKKVQRILYPQASGIVFQTRDAQKWFPQKIQKKSCIIMNQIDANFFNTPRAEALYYCAIGRLTKQKNYEVMIRAFSNFNKIYSNELLYIYGAGPCEEKLKQLIKELGAENNIFLMGITDNIPSVLSNAKAFIMSSDYEGMPNALLEAMAMGLPVISTDCPCGGPNMLIENGKNGILTSVGNIDDIKNSLIKIQIEVLYAEMLGKNARESVLKFRPEVVFEQWENYVYNCINRYLPKTMGGK